jgi:nitrous oxidase accessory protein
MMYLMLKFHCRLLLLAFFFVPGTIVHAKKAEVCPTCEHQSIVSAIEQCQAYDTLIVHPGHYVEELIVINRPITIIGIDGPVIENNKNGEGILVRADRVSLQGLHIKNVHTSYTRDYAGIRLEKVKHCTLRKNTLTNTFFGIYLQHSKHCVIDSNLVAGQAQQEMSSGNALQLWYCDSIQVTNNTVSGHRDGIYLEFVTHSTITGNLSTDNIRYGLHFMFSHFNKYQSNRFISNGTGVAVMYSDSISMYQNYFADNWGPSSYGILLKDIRYSVMEDNTFQNNTVAIHADNASRNEIKFNMLENNGWAVKIMGNCNENKFTGNTFSNNNFDISTPAKTSNNLVEGNYWSRYKGYDLDKNGVGDVPYNPVTLSSYIVTNFPASIILTRSLFLEFLDATEKAVPVFVPTDLTDQQPLMKKKQ